MKRDIFQFEVFVTFPNSTMTHSVKFDLCSHYANPFRPYDRCLDKMSAVLSHGVTEDEANKIDVSREELALSISSRITAAIMQTIKTQDSIAGRKQ